MHGYYIQNGLHIIHDQFELYWVGYGYVSGARLLATSTEIK